MKLTKSITGTFIPIESNNRKIYLYNCEFDGNFFYESYSSFDESMKFGSFLVKLNGNGTEFRGQFVGYGNVYENILVGDIIVKKKNR